MDFFVMLYTQDGGFTPLISAESAEPGVDEKMAKFESEEEACAGARSSSLGLTFGFEVFRIGEGNFHSGGDC